jgi:cold shock CspA family protein
LTTVREKILITLASKESMSSEDIFLHIRAVIDDQVRMLTVERVLYDLVKDGSIGRIGNVYSLKYSPTAKLSWLEQENNYE